MEHIYIALSTSLILRALSSTRQLIGCTSVLGYRLCFSASSSLRTMSYHQATLLSCVWRMKSVWRSVSSTAKPETSINSPYLPFADGFYRVEPTSVLRDGYITHVWFSHCLTGSQSSTYIIHGCPGQVKDLMPKTKQSQRYCGL